MLWSAFLLGFLGSIHCLAMCGPIVFALSFSTHQLSVSAAGYQIGRLLGYGILGLLAGVVGVSFSWAGIHQGIAIVIGTVLCLYGLTMLLPFFKKNGNTHFLSLLSLHIQQRFIQLYVKYRSKSFFTAGILHGFLPCGLVYVALSGAILQPHPVDGMLYMVCFGIGTLPMMSGILLLGYHDKLKLKTSLRKLIPVVTFLFGAWILIRGLGFDIPFISPADSHLDLITETQSCDPLD